MLSAIDVESSVVICEDCEKSSVLRRFVENLGHAWA